MTHTTEIGPYIHTKYVMFESKIIVLWTVPRCCGTAFELMMEARGDFRIETNVFDPVFYFSDKAGSDLPKKNPHQQPVSFEKVFHDFLSRSTQYPTFLRNTAYAVSKHFRDVNWSKMTHCFLIRNPLYVLPSHRRFVKEITVDEAGYTSQLALFHCLNQSNVNPIVIDAHDLLANPDKMVEMWCNAVGVTFLPHALQWSSGFRSRWDMWSHWKKQASESTCFLRFGRDLNTEIIGKNDPLFNKSNECYQELFRYRLIPPDLRFGK